MTMLLITVFLSVMQAAPPLPRQATDNSAGTSGNVTNQTKSNQKLAAQPPPAIKQNEATSQNPDGNKQGNEGAEHSINITKLPSVTVVAAKRDWADWGYWAFNLFLVIVGGLQIWLLWRTLGAIKRQADIMDAQKEILQESVSAAKANADSAEANAVAAKEGAQAASRNIEMFISKERARLRVTLKPLVLSAPKFESTYVVDFSVKNCGPSTAFITQSSCVTYYGPQQMVESEQETGTAIMFPIHLLPSELSDNTPIETFAFIFFHDIVSFALSEIKEERFFVGIRGAIAYDDVFGKQRNTTFRYIWKLSPIRGVLGVDPFMGEWIKCGSPEDNKET
jgi:hypothetical protein